MRIPLLLTAILAVAAARADAPPSDALARTNADFRAIYREAKARVLAGAGPVLLVEGDVLVLRNGSERKTERFLPPGYAALKEASHVPLALFVLLFDTEGPLSDPTRHALEALVTEVKRARSALWAQPFPKGTLGRQERVLDASAAFAEAVVRRGAVAPGKVSGFARTMGPLLEANADDAAALELEALQKQVEAWRVTLGSDWRRLHVVVMGSHMARTNEIAMQYFERLLGEAREGGRVVFAEGVWDEEVALDLLATHLLDGSASEAFFGDAARLHADVLGEGARKYLGAHPPK